MKPTHVLSHHHSASNSCPSYILYSLYTCTVCSKAYITDRGLLSVSTLGLHWVHSSKPGVNPAGFSWGLLSVRMGLIGIVFFISNNQCNHGTVFDTYDSVNNYHNEYFSSEYFV